jgi:hypothetical protein
MPAESSPEPDPAPNREGDDPFAEFGDSFDAPDGPGPAGDFGGSEAHPSGLDASLVLTLTRSWVKQHQKLTMLGAFATGVVLGSLLRD